MFSKYKITTYISWFSNTVCFLKLHHGCLLKFQDNTCISNASKPTSALEFQEYVHSWNFKTASALKIARFPVPLKSEHFPRLLLSLKFPEYQCSWNFKAASALEIQDCWWPWNSKTASAPEVSISRFPLLLKLQDVQCSWNFKTLSAL